MFAGLAVASVLASAPAPSPAPAANPHDDARFELHLGGRAGGRFLGSEAAISSARSFGGGVSLGLGVRLWRGLYLEAGVGESVYTNPERRLGGALSFRHLGPHAGDGSPQTGASGSASAETGAEAEAEAGASIGLGAEAGSAALLVGQILLGLRYEVRTRRTLRVRPSVFLGLTHLHEATIADLIRAPGKTIAGTGKFIRHRTGVQLGAGLRFPFPERWGPVAPRFSVRLDGDFAYYFDAHPGRVQAGLGLGVQVVF